MKFINMIAILLVLIGGLNWGLIAVFDFNLVGFLFSRLMLEKIIYFLVGISAIYLAIAWKNIFKS